MLLIQDLPWNYVVPYGVNLKDWVNCAQVTCINIHRYRCKMPVFLIWLSSILDFRRLVGPFPERRNQRGLNTSFFFLHITFYHSCMSLVTLCISCLPHHPHLQSLYHSYAQTCLVSVCCIITSCLSRIRYWVETNTLSPELSAQYILPRTWDLNCNPLLLHVIGQLL